MKILYVEDNDDNVWVVKNRLTRWGHAILVAPDGRQGIDMGGHSDYRAVGARDDRRSRESARRRL